MDNPIANQWHGVNIPVRKSCVRTRPNLPRFEVSDLLADRGRDVVIARCYLAHRRFEQACNLPLHNAVMKLDRYTRLLATVVVVLVFIGLSALAIKHRSVRKAEWYNYASLHGCERVATKKGDIHVTPPLMPLNNFGVTMLSTVEVDDDIHAWRCRDGSVHLNRWR